MTPRAGQAITRALVVQARHVVRPDGTCAAGALTIVRGRIVRVAASRPAARRDASRSARAVDLGDVALVPGYVDAHAHLDLSHLRGRVPKGASFVAWIRALIAARRACAEQDLAGAARRGADELLAGGTTLVGDVDSLGLTVAALEGHSLRVRSYREVLDAGDAARRRAAIALVRAPALRSSRRFAGISPHAPYSVSEALWTALGRLPRARRAHVSIHWAESRDEDEWMEHATGAFADLLASSSAPRRRGLELIERAGLLGPRTLLVHANHVRVDERARVAAARAAVVHCPGSHDFFGRERFDAGSWLAAGVTLALGTDSLASNERLDMRREMALFANAHAAIAPARVLAMATSGGARALGLSGRAGVLAPGAWADFSAQDVGPIADRDVVEALVRSVPRVAATWIAGSPRAGDGLD